MFLNKINIIKGLDYIELEDGYIKISEFEQSELAFKKAPSIDSEFVNNYYGLTEVYTKRENKKPAIHDLKK